MGAVLIRRQLSDSREVRGGGATALVFAKDTVRQLAQCFGQREGVVSPLFGVVILRLELPVPAKFGHAHFAFASILVARGPYMLTAQGLGSLHTTQLAFRKPAAATRVQPTQEFPSPL